MKIGRFVGAALAVCLLWGCEQKSTAGKVEDSVNDALDRRPAEGVQDAVEDAADATSDAAQKAADAAKEAARKAAEAVK